MNYLALFWALAICLWVGTFFAGMHFIDSHGAESGRLVRNFFIAATITTCVAAGLM